MHFSFTVWTNILDPDPHGAPLAVGYDDAAAIFHLKIFDEFFRLICSQ